MSERLGQDVETAPPLDRRRTVQRRLARSQKHAPPDADFETEAWEADRFAARAQALFYARLAFLTLGILMLAVPEWRGYFGLNSKVALGVYLGMLVYGVANYLTIGLGKLGRVITYVTLCFDLVILVILIAKPAINSGLQSPFLATQLVYTTLFAILFPRPLAILPPLLALPIITRLDLLLNRPAAAIDVLTLLWYAVMNVVIVYVVVYMNRREAASHREILELQSDLKTLAVVEERNRLAREVHDGIGGSLSSLIIQAEYLMGLANDETMRHEIADLKGSAEESIDELRRSLRMMREDFDLSTAVEEHIKSFAERTGLAVVFEREGNAARLPAEHQLTVFRVLQEALSNAVKHAQPQHIWVKLWFEPQAVHLTVRDDGVGFHPLQRRDGHYGLLHMRERAAQSAGIVVIDSAPGDGTRISLSIPLEGSP